MTFLVNDEEIDGKKHFFGYDRGRNLQSTNSKEWMRRQGLLAVFVSSALGLGLGLHALPPEGVFGSLISLSALCRNCAADSTFCQPSLTSCAGQP